jgi:hypothetical protein
MIYIPFHKGKVFPLRPGQQTDFPLTDESSAWMSGRVLTPQEVRSEVTCSVYVQHTPRENKNHNSLVVCLGYVTIQLGVKWFNCRNQLLISVTLTDGLTD